MNTVEKIIQEVKNKSEKLQNQVEDYLNVITELQNALGNGEWHLEMRYHPNSYNGRKICFGSYYQPYGGRQPNCEKLEMLKALIINNQIESFLNYLTAHAFPLFLSDSKTYIPDFHF